MPASGEGDGQFRIGVLNDLRQRFDALPKHIRECATNRVMSWMRNPTNAWRGEGQQVTDGMAWDRAKDEWFYVSVRFRYVPAERIGVIVFVESEKSVPLH